MKIIVIATVLALFAFAAQANPVCDVNRSQAKNDLKQELLNRYGNSYSTVEMLLISRYERL